MKIEKLTEKDVKDYLMTVFKKHGEPMVKQAMNVKLPVFGNMNAYEFVKEIEGDKEYAWNEVMEIFKRMYG